MDHAVAEAGLATWQWLVLIMSSLTGVCIPVLIFLMDRHNRMLGDQNVLREQKFDELNKRLSHLDECVDDVRGVVLSRGVTREDLSQLKADITGLMNTMRLAISGETNALHQRVFRLENRAFGTQQHD